MLMEVCPNSIFPPLHLTAVTIVSGSHGLGGLPCVLGSTEPTGDQIHAEGGLAGVVSLDGVLPLGLGGHVPGLAILMQHMHLPSWNLKLPAGRTVVVWISS